MSIDVNSQRDKSQMEPQPKVYETPRLTVHGSLQSITANVGNNGNPDGPKGSQADL
jgi:hypothetical protein